MLDAYPSLQKMYKADDGNTEVFYFENATAIFHHLLTNHKLLIFNHKLPIKEAFNRCFLYKWTNKINCQYMDR